MHGLPMTCLVVASALTGSAALAAPQPSLVPKSWELEIDFYDPARIEVTLPGESKPAVFWYVLYTVTNRTGRDVSFYPQFELVTDTLDVVRGGDGVSLRVYDAIRERHGKLHPFMVEPLEVSGRLLQGKENSRTSAAIFRDFNRDASRFTLFMAGLSGEVVRVPNPAFDSARPADEQNPQFFTLRKTLAIKYDLPGDLGTRESSVPIRTNREWVMR